MHSEGVAGAVIVIHMAQERTVQGSSNSRTVQGSSNSKIGIGAEAQPRLRRFPSGGKDGIGRALETELIIGNTVNSLVVMVQVFRVLETTLAPRRKTWVDPQMCPLRFQGNQRQPYLLRGAFEPQKERKPDRSVVNRSIALLLNSEASCGICDDSRVKDVHSLWMDAS